MMTTHGITRFLASFSEVVDVLGGTKRVATLTRSSRSSVWNWKQAGQFPAKHYRLIRELLFEHGCVADLTLFAFSDLPTEQEPIADTVAA